MEETRPSRWIVTSEGYRIRPLRSEDQELMFLWRTNPETSKYLKAPPPPSLEAQRRWFSSVEEGTDIYYLLTLEGEEASAIGYACFLSKCWEDRAAKLGLVLGEQARSGKGKSFAFLLLRLGFEKMGLTKVLGSVDPENSPAARLLQFVGGQSVSGPHAYRKENEDLYEINNDRFFAIEEKLRREDPQFPCLPEYSAAGEE